MKKRSKKEEMAINKLKEEINSMLFRALGYEIDSAGYVIDQDTSYRLTYRNRPIKCLFTEVYVPLHSRDIIFDPYTNRSFAEELFTTFMHKEEVDNGIYMLMYSSNPTDIGTYVEVIVQDHDTGERKTFMSDKYAILPLCYIDLILRIYNSSIDNYFVTAIRSLEGYLKDDLQ